MPDHRTGEASHRPARVQLGVVVGAQIQLIQISRRILQIIREKVALTHFRFKREVFSIIVHIISAPGKRKRRRSLKYLEIGHHLQTLEIGWMSTISRKH